MVHRSPFGDALDVCFELTDWPSYTDHWAPNKKFSVISPPTPSTQVSCALSSWLYDGNFMKGTLQKYFSAVISAKELPITSLSIVPLFSLPSEKKESLVERGRMFWKCRRKRYISYEGWDFERLEHFVSNQPGTQLNWVRLGNVWKELTALCLDSS